MKVQRRTKKQQRDEERDRKNTALREASKGKMIDALVGVEPAPFSLWLTASRFKSRSYFVELVKELIEERRVANVNSIEKHPSYVVLRLSERMVLQHLSCSFLYVMLERIEVAKDGEKAITDFNKHLGSLTLYVLKHYDSIHAEEILRAILNQLWAYLNYPETVGGVISKKEPNIETKEWKLWRDIGSREYVTTALVPRNTSVMEGEKQGSERQNRLPCSGNCWCDKATEGCMTRLILAKAKNVSAVDAISRLDNKKKRDRDALVEIEAIDWSKFSEKWLKL